VFRQTITTLERQRLQVGKAIEKLAKRDFGGRLLFDIMYFWFDRKV
jgi:hypothetical protein